MNTPANASATTGASPPSRHPEYPSHNTQAARLLATLLLKDHVEPLEGWRALGIYRLADAVLQLRRLGWPVVTGRLDVANRFGEACHVANYFLEVETIESAGDEGKAFAACEAELMSEGRAA